MEREQLLMDMVAHHEKRIYETADHIWKNPETGYREWKTSEYLAAQFEELGYTLTKAGDIPGFYTDLDTGVPGPKVAILGELDSLIVKNHPDALPDTFAVHACGHNAQCATLIGVAAALKEPGALDGLCGSVRLIAVPAEELIELGFRKSCAKKA
jgi:metal-dependent amidase/aminoacylase/carboxypeptidase family protein